MIIFQSIKFWQPGSNKWSCNYTAENMSWYIYWHELFCLFREEWWEISIIFLVLISTKGTEESSALDSIIIDLIKTCSFCTKINFYTPVFRRDVLWYGAVRPSVRPSSQKNYYQHSRNFGTSYFCLSYLLHKQAYVQLDEVTPVAGGLTLHSCYCN